MLLPKLAYRNILRQRRRSLLTALSMCGGYILLAFSISLVNGSYGNLIDMFTRDHTGHIQIHYQNYLKRPRIHKAIHETDLVEQGLRESASVVSFAPRIFSPALAYANDKSTPVSVTGIDPAREQTTSTLSGKVKAGSYFSDAPGADGYFPAMIGFGVANSLKLDIGDEIVLISQGADGSIANDIYRVEAKVGNKTSHERQSVFLPMAAMRDFLTMHSGVHEYAILVEDSDLAFDVAADLRGTLPNKDWTISPWQEVEESFYKSMKSDIQGNYVTLGIIIFLVCIGVLNTVLMSVLERTREFGVLRAIGTNPSRIMYMIMTETGFLALLSCLLGFLISVPIIAFFTFEGITLSQTIDIGGIPYNKMLGEFSFEVFFYPVVVIVLAALAISVPPALRAARIVPVEALRSH